MTEDNLCGLFMLHVHRNDTVGQVNPGAVLTPTKYCHLKLFDKIIF